MSHLVNSSHRPQPSWRGLLLGLSVLSISTTALAGPCPETAQRYWDTFRRSVVNGDPQAVADASRFPFLVNGTLDDSNIRRVQRKTFIRLLPSLLRTDPGLTAEPSTMKALIQATEQLSPTFCNARGNQMRVGSWVFEQTPQGWRFVQGFLDD